MANDLNRCDFIGRLGKDPEIRYTPNGTAVANFSIAVGEKWKDKNTGEQKEKTEWIRVVAFGKLAEICGEYLEKGKQIYLSGKLQTREWDDKEGNKRYTTEIVANQIQTLGDGNRDGGSGSFGKPQSNKPQPQVKQQPSGTEWSEPEDSDIPF